MRSWLPPFVVGVILPFVLAALFIGLGGMPVATRGGPLPMEKLIANVALDAAMRGETDRKSPLTADDTTFRLGAKVYGVNCAVCHGYPNEKPSAIAAGMFPRPPQLLPPKKGVTDDEVGETYWKVKNGIRLTGMPGFSETLTDQEMWAVSMLLQSADRLPAGILESIRH